MGLLDDYSGPGGILGIGMTPRPAKKHQIIIRYLVVSLENEGIFCLSEFCVDDRDLNSKVPDIVIYENEADRYPVVIIEITTKNVHRQIIEKVKQLLKDYPMIQEAFVYDYESNQWFCFGKDVDADEPSYSPMLDIDFADMIEL